MDLEGTLTLLAQTPASLTALLTGLPEAMLLADEGPETFSARDVVGHLIHGEETDWVPRIRIILEHGESRPFTPFDRTGFRDAIAGRPIQELLERFARLRRSNLEAVHRLDLGPEQLARRGTHPALGTVTLGELLASWVVHDLGHLAQISRVLARPYRDDVGPWREYLSILGK
jgi:DinB family protein